MCQRANIHGLRSLHGWLSFSRSSDPHSFVRTRDKSKHYSTWKVIRWIQPLGSGSCQLRGVYKPKTYGVQSMSQKMAETRVRFVHVPRMHNFFSPRLFYETLPADKTSRSTVCVFLCVCLFLSLFLCVCLSLSLFLVCLSCVCLFLEKLQHLQGLHLQGVDETLYNGWRVKSRIKSGG